MITVETIINNVSYTIEFSDIPTLSITQAVAAANTATAAMSIVETKRVEVENTAVIVQQNSTAAAQDRQTTQALRNETEAFKNTAINAANQAIEYVETNEYVTRAGAQEITGEKIFTKNMYIRKDFIEIFLESTHLEATPLKLRNYIAGVSNGGMSIFDTIAQKNRMVISASGSIGVGVDDPKAAFEVGSNGSTVHKIRSVTGGAYYVSMPGSSVENMVAFGDASAIIGGEPGTRVMLWTNNLPLFFPFGSLILGGTENQGQRLQVVGDGRFTGSVSAASFVQNSSLRYKQDVETLENALDTVLAMRGVSYVRKDNGEKEIGFIAEEVHELLPDVVVLNKEQQPDAIAYSQIIPVLVEAMKQQQEQIDELKKQDELRSKEIHDLKAIVNYLKTKL